MAAGTIRDWTKHPVTFQFMDMIRDMLEQADANCHVALAKANFEEAANWNAHIDSLNEVMNLPDEMINEATGGEQ